jgi:hypothetical protein
VTQLMIFLIDQKHDLRELPRASGWMKSSRYMKKTLQEGITTFIDSCSIMEHYGKTIFG